MHRCSTKSNEYIKADADIMTAIKQRMFMRGFPLTTTIHDIEGLFNRVGEVEEVYLPGPSPTGLFRDFAIVTMTFPSENDISKCSKTLNNVLWKGNKIQVEVAKQYYQEKLEIERMEEAQKLQEEQEETPTLMNGRKSTEEGVFEYLNALPKFDPYNDVSMYLNIKNSSIRGSKPLSVRTVPATDHLSSVAKAKLQRSRKLRFGWKTIFNDNCEPIVSTQNEANSSDGSKFGIPEKNESKESLFRPTVGRRVGFGTLLADAEKYPENYEEVRDSSYITHVPNESDEEEEEEDIRTKLRNIYDDDQEVMICKEKDRTQNLLAEFLSKSEEHSTISPKMANDAGNSSTSTSFIDTVDGDKKEGKVIETKDSFVNISKLSDIFHKDGGIWWGDDGTLKETVMKGNIDQVDSARFREAEKLGIDIRPVTEEEKSSKSFKLNFFPEDNDGNNLPSSNSAESSSSFSFGFKTNEIDGEEMSSSLFEATRNKGIKRGIESIEEYNSRIEREEYESKLRTPVSLQYVISACKLFVREETEEDFKELWKLQREKLITDYKRKKRDSKRRTKYHGKAINVGQDRESSGIKKGWGPRLSNKKYRGAGGKKRLQKR